MNGATEFPRRGGNSLDEAGCIRRKPVIGLAGGIASGKSMVAEQLRRLGCAIVDSDQMVHDELAKPDVVQTFESWWGQKVVDSEGRINRQVMSEIIFSEAEQRKRMESFLYPRLERRREKMMLGFEDDPAVRAIVIDSPLLFEVGLDKLCDAVIFTECDRDVRVGRARESRGWTESEFDRREMLQKSLDMKARMADYRVVNNSTIDALLAQVTPLFERLIEAQASSR